MLNAKKIYDLLVEINIELQKRDTQGEILLCGGAVMCLVYHARVSTRDVDAIFAPSQIIRDIVRNIGQKHNLEEDWLNDAVKGFISSPLPKRELYLLSHLKVFIPEPSYLLAMKCLAARFDSFDQEDTIFLVRYLELKNPAEVFQLIEKFYPQQRIPAKTQFFIEEFFSEEI